MPEAATSAILSVTNQNMPKMDRKSQDTGGNTARQNGLVFCLLSIELLLDSSGSCDWQNMILKLLNDLLILIKKTVLQQSKYITTFCQNLILILQESVLFSSKSHPVHVIFLSLLITFNQELFSGSQNRHF